MEERWNPVEHLLGLEQIGTPRHCRARTASLMLVCLAYRYTDAYAGKKAKLPDAALQNEAGKFIRYSKADWTFPGVNISIPAATADWSKFNLTNLPGEKTYPVVTTSILLTNNDLTGRGESPMFTVLLLSGIVEVQWEIFVW